eukprot:TRINITY_DN31_c2_g1_i7.p1 TRINITY_DN31_c2_g1~~TRINITY_DN31_c2_g1_i7.p1  ORF type:complete len:179 (-),score=22.77 TRINITY_DN31_c2_g1_i7:560-1096(-)
MRCRRMTRVRIILQRVTPRGKALELVFTGRVFPARNAATAAPGLFNSVHATREDAMQSATTLAREIASHTSPTAVSMAKALLTTSAGLDVDVLRRAHILESDALGKAFASKDPVGAQRRQGDAPRRGRIPPVLARRQPETYCQSGCAAPNLGEQQHFPGGFHGHPGKSLDHAGQYTPV